MRNLQRNGECRRSNIDSESVVLVNLFYHHWQREVKKLRNEDFLRQLHFWGTGRPLINIDSTKCISG